jgi:uncharacterized membrane protein
MPTVVTAEFETREGARRAVEELIARGFNAVDISAISQEEHFPFLLDAGRAVQGALAGAAVSAFLGLIVAGPMIPVVMAAGGLLGALLNVGLSMEEARQTEQSLATGHTLVVVHRGDPDEARKILAREGGKNIRTVTSQEAAPQSQQ